MVQVLVRAGTANVPGIAIVSTYVYVTRDVLSWLLEVVFCKYSLMSWHNTNAGASQAFRSKSLG